MSGQPDSLRVLAALRDLDEAAFARLLVRRQVPARGLSDPMDLAEWLTEPAHIDAALARLGWLTLRGLRRGESAALAQAQTLQLAVAAGEGQAERAAGAEHPALLTHVAEQLALLLPSVPEFTAPGEVDTHRGHELVQVAADVLWLLDERPRPVHHARTGDRLSAVEVRRLATDLDRPAELTAGLFALLVRARLAAPAGELWAPTVRGRSFSTLSAAVQWGILASAWVDAVTLAEVQDAAWERPVAAALGLARGGTAAAPSRLGGLVLDGCVAQAQTEFAAHLAAPATGVYVQPDLTLIAPGPVPGATDAALREFCELERRALASEYRLTRASVSRALAGGLTAKQVHARLAELALTSVPQPVTYLIDETAARFGTVRVCPITHLSNAQTRVRTLEAALLETLRVDTALGALTLRPAPDGPDLVSAASCDTVLATLLEAHYPAAREDAAGRLVPTPAPVTADDADAPVPSTVAMAARDLAERAHDDADNAPLAWLRRRLEAAVRARDELRVEVAVGSDTTELDLVPISVSGARLRARDLEAEVERTVPLRAIVAVDGLRVAGAQ